jgi:hypothetical protein
LGAREMRMNSGEIHSLYRSPNIVRRIKYRRLRWAGHVFPCKIEDLIQYINLRYGAQAPKIVIL